MELHRLISGPPPGRDLLSKLPSELKQRVLDFVDFEDHLSIRLVSRLWSIAAFERTWSHGLVLRPNKNHVQKLIEISRRPWLSERINKVVFSLADVDYAVLRHVRLPQSLIPSLTSGVYRSTTSPRLKIEIQFFFFFQQHANTSGLSG